MKALILTSGMGKRLSPLTDKTHKSLIEVDGRPILGRILDMLVKNKIFNVVITTGYFNRKVISFVKKNYPRLKPEFIYNKRFESTNYIYSMWLARKKLTDDDILYLHSDLFFDPKLVKRLLKSNNSCVLVNRRYKSEKDFNARILHGQVKRIWIRLPQKKCRFCLPIYKFKKDDFTIWMKRINKMVRSGETGVYAEAALNQVINKINLYPIFFDRRIGMEIDDFDDLQRAEKLLKRI